MLQIGEEINRLLGLDRKGKVDMQAKRGYEVPGRGLQSKINGEDRTQPSSDPEPEPPPSAKPGAPASVEYGLLVRHAINDEDEEIWLKVSSDWTFARV
eukprot:CAMPEP_0177285244 /NCGR_PEP_ID=MMETSP0367-20130122/72966_1 /TAXON_ID=447022 ORGANISM="Scrippsiella hangoei-like, Strain SHHI-4" /NCGR_SAMPLE_ID=MMETSP0367 /ASSEMBLY_ACC=CAM_ASM_000362 /LENGTH=97 /DNA_ID=CAMNT_0018742371 /DNA_START=1 /DNA_END=291 /DNA_ORIENTATION=-